MSRGKPAIQVVDYDEFQHGGVYEEHADAIPQIHGGEVRDDGQGGAEAVRGGAKVEHGGDADHDAGWDRVDVQPETDEGARDQHHTWNKHGANVERLVAREHQEDT